MEQLIVVARAKAVERAANQFVQLQFAVQAAQRFGVRSIFQDRLGGGAGAPQTGDQPAHGGDLDMAGGVADQVDIATENLPPRSMRRCG